MTDEPKEYWEPCIIKGEEPTDEELEKLRRLNDERRKRLREKFEEDDGA